MACLKLFVLAFFLVIFVGLLTEAKPIDKPEERNEKEVVDEVSKGDDDDDSDEAEDTSNRSKVPKAKKEANDCKREFHVQGACHPFHEHPEFEGDGMNNYGDEEDDDGDKSGKCCFRDRRSVVVKQKLTPEAENATEANSTTRCGCGCCHHHCHHCHHGHHSHHCHHSCCGHHSHHSHHCHHCHHNCCGHRREPLGVVRVPGAHHISTPIHHVNAVGGCGGLGTGAIANPVGTIGNGVVGTGVVGTGVVGTGVVGNGVGTGVVGGNGCCDNTACGSTTVHNVPVKVKVGVGPVGPAHHVNNGCVGTTGVVGGTTGVVGGVGTVGGGCGGFGNRVANTGVVGTTGCGTYKSEVSSGEEPETNDSH